jgi:hypothetical protein
MFDIFVIFGLLLVVASCLEAKRVNISQMNQSRRGKYTPNMITTLVLITNEERKKS